MSDSKSEETFKVVDRRLFTPEGEFRKDVAEQQDREHDAASQASKSTAGKSPVSPGPVAIDAAKKTEPSPLPSEPLEVNTAKRSPGFENLVRSLGQNAAMLLGGYADPRTGQPMLDLDGAREMIDMLDALREKTAGNLAPEEDSLIIDVLGNLKLAFMEMTKAATAAAMKDKAKSHT